jgi:kynureninase
MYTGDRANGAAATPSKPAEMSTTTTAPRLRERFPTLESATYLVSHSMGAAPLGARDALRAYWEAWAKDGPEAWEGWLPELAEIADGIGALIGAPDGSMSLAPNVSLVQAALASALDWRGERNEVVFEELQFPSVTYVWKAWERFGARVVRVPSDDGRTMSTERLVAAITEKTAVVVLSHAAYVSSALIDVPAVAARCRETGALFVLDVYQTTGVYPYDVSALDLDLAVGGSHKWLCGGPGCGFVYVRPSLRARLEPAITGWMAHESPFTFEPAPIRLAWDQHRWNTGTPTVPGYLVARTGHDTIREIGVGNVRAHNLRLTTKIAELAQERGFTIPTPLDPNKRAGWMGFDFPGADRVVQQLFERRIFVDYRPGCGIRVGPHFYTADHEIDALFAAVDDLRTSA